MKILAIIPARGGSKGLPGKNIHSLCGKPLIAYSIEAAKRCSYVDRIVVSTESYNIAEVATNYGAEVPFLRPSDLSGDKADLGSVIGNTLWGLENEGYSPAAHIVLLPTSPFRTKGLLDYLCCLLVKGHKNVHSVREIKPKIFCKRDASGTLNPFKMNEFYDSSKMFFRNYGLFGGSNRYGTLQNYAHIINNSIMLIDIDTPDDLQLAEAVLQAEAFDFNSECTGNETTH